MKEKLTIALLKEAEDGSMASNETHEMKCSKAIKKMAKGLCNMYYLTCSACAFKNKPKDCESLLKTSDFYEQAEVALNALLEEKK